MACPRYPLHIYVCEDCGNEQVVYDGGEFECDECGVLLCYSCWCVNVLCRDCTSKMTTVIDRALEARDERLREEEGD